MKQRSIIIPILLILFSINLLAKSDTKTVSFQYYGSQWSVRLSKNLRFTVPDTSQASIFDTIYIEKYIQETYEDCLSLKKQKRLNDWAYMKMLDSLSVACYGDGNEATLMKSYIFAKSGYDILIFRESNSLHMGYYSRYTVYGRTYYTIDEKNYYLDTEIVEKNKLLPYRCKGKPVSFDMRELPILDHKRTRKRIIESGKAKILGGDNIKKRPAPIVEVSVNQNLINFYGQYPSTMKNYDFITRWAMMANVPMSDDVKQQIYPTIRKHLEGLNQVEAVQRLLNFTSTALSYEYDEDVWGRDRAFFSEETLFYPSADDEDRVILLSRLIRDLVGLEVVILYFPGHLSMAVHFDEDIEGAGVIYNGDRFVICDPTYIGSDVGETIPTFQNEDPQRMVLLYK